MKNKICHLTSSHKRNDTRIFIKQCSSLSECNYEVSLIVADGLGDEKKKGIKIYDVGKSEGKLNRFFITTAKIYKKAYSLKSDVYHFHDPELIFFGLILKLRKRKVIYDMHEDMSQQLKIRSWIPKIIRPLISFLFEFFEKIIIKKMDALIVPQPYMKEKFLKLNKNTELVENFVVFENKHDISNKDYSTKLAFHAGALTKERGLINMINSYALLDAENRLFLAGNIKEDLLQEVEKLEGWNKVDYLGVIKYEEVQDFYKKSSIGLILYNNVGQYHLSYAIKLFEYMKNGLPVIMPNFGEWIHFNEQNDCGINVDPTNHIEVSNAIKKLNQNIEEKKRLGYNGYNAVKRKYNWKEAEERLFNLYDSII